MDGAIVRGGTLKSMLSRYSNSSTLGRACPCLYALLKNTYPYYILYLIKDLKMFRVLRFLTYCWKWGRLKKPWNPGTIETLWLRAYFSLPQDIGYINNVIKVIADVSAITMPHRPVKSWKRLYRFKRYDVKYFMGLDLERQPTQSAMCILIHFGDLSEHELLKYWSWAVTRDQCYRGKYGKNSRYTDCIQAMQSTITLTQEWVTKRNEVCQPSNIIALPMGYQQV